MLCDNTLLNAFAVRKKAADMEALASALQDLSFKGWKDEKIVTDATKSPKKTQATKKKERKIE